MRRVVTRFFATMLLFGCQASVPSVDDGGVTGPVTALHNLHLPTMLPKTPTGDQDFYALPFPNNLRLRENGTIDMSGYPRLGGILQKAVEACDSGCRGLGTNAGIYFRFSGALDEASLPKTPADTLSDSANAFVVDITEGSPTYGQRAPVIPHYVDSAYAFIGAHWLTLVPVPGFPLRQKTTYAAILTDSIVGKDGVAIRPAADFVAAMASGSADDAVGKARAAYAPLATFLGTHADLKQHLVNATVFTTLDATSLIAKIRAAVYAQVPAPTVSDLTWMKDKSNNVSDVYEGTYQGPNFQEGDSPYTISGGAIHFGDDGLPAPVRIETLRVAMTIPKGTIPDAGWPVVLYAHGTGGDFESFLRDSSGRRAAQVQDKAGNIISKMAMISIDQVLHGPRAPEGTDVQLAFFNLQNFVSARDNAKQGALDDFQLLRLCKGLKATAVDMQPIKFDPDRIYFKGHSQGGLTGSLFLPAEPEVKAAILSGDGAVLVYSLINKTEPVNVKQLVGTIIPDPVDEFHPLLNLLQTYFEDSDPANYAARLFKEPATGFAPKSIFQSLGVVDHYTPVPNIKALALAMGVQPAGDPIEPIDYLAMANLSWTMPPVSGNVASGKATAVLVEYAQKSDSDGHFVVFDVPSATAQSNRFLATHAATGIASLLAP